MSSLAERPFSPIAVAAAGLVMLGSLVGVGLFQWHKNFAPPVEIPDGTVLQARDLRFVDLKDGATVFGGGVRVFDMASGAEYAPLRVNDGFVRAALNALQFERAKRDLKGDPVFRLTSWADGRLTLGDPETGARISLGSFGAKNKTVFLRFVDAPEATK